MLIFPLHQASITIEGIKFVVDCGFVKVVNASLRWNCINLFKGSPVRRCCWAVVIKSRSDISSVGDSTGGMGWADL